MLLPDWATAALEQYLVINHLFEQQLASTAIRWTINALTTHRRQIKGHAAIAYAPAWIHENLLKNRFSCLLLWGIAVLAVLYLRGQGLPKKTLIAKQ